MVILSDVAIGMNGSAFVFILNFAIKLMLFYRLLIGIKVQAIKNK